MGEPLAANPGRALRSARDGSARTCSGRAGHTRCVSDVEPSRDSFHGHASLAGVRQGALGAVFRHVTAVSYLAGSRGGGGIWGRDWLGLGGRSEQQQPHEPSLRLVGTLRSCETGSRV